MRLHDVLQAVRLWVETAACKQGFRTDVVRSDDRSLWVFFESADKMGELIVAQAEYAPYRYVSFQILRIDETPVFCYYDSDTSTIHEIMEQLDAGLNMM